MNEKSNHHHVPRFILKQWISDKSKGLKVFSKTKGWLAKGNPIINPKSICYRKNLYETKHLPLNYIEDGYQSLEHFISIPYKKLCNGQAKIDELTKIERMAIGYIPFMLYLRQPDALDAIEQAITIIKQESQELSSLDQDGRLLSDLGRATISGVGPDEIIGKLHQAFLEFFFEHVWNTKRILWECIEPSENGRFLETDRGTVRVMVCESDRYSSVFYTPLSPSKCLVAYPAKYKKYVQIRKGSVDNTTLRMINDTLFRAADDLVIYPTT